MGRRTDDGGSRHGTPGGRASRAAGWRRAAGAAVLLTGLGLSSTAVLAYADLLPRAFELPFGPGDEAATALPRVPLPHLARALAAGEPVRIVAFGSSSTEGVGASTPGAAYPARLEGVLRRALPRLASLAVLNRGRGGEAVDQMLARLDRDVLGEHPHLVIWQTGSNDPLRGVGLDHFRAATRAAVERIRAAGIDVVLMEPQWCPRLDAVAGSERFRDAVRAVGAELGVPVIRRADLMRAWIAEHRLTARELFAPDGLHMADRGYDLLARAVAEDVLREAGAVPVPPVARQASAQEAPAREAGLPAPRPDR